MSTVYNMVACAGLPKGLITPGSGVEGANVESLQSRQISDPGRGHVSGLKSIESTPSNLGPAEAENKVASAQEGEWVAVNHPLSRTRMKDPETVKVATVLPPFPYAMPSPTVSDQYDTGREAIYFYLDHTHNELFPNIDSFVQPDAKTNFNSELGSWLPIDASKVTPANLSGTDKLGWCVFRDLGLSAYTFQQCPHLDLTIDWRATWIETPIPTTMDNARSRRGWGLFISRNFGDYGTAVTDNPLFLVDSFFANAYLTSNTVATAIHKIRLEAPDEAAYKWSDYSFCLLAIWDAHGYPLGTGVPALNAYFNGFTSVAVRGAYPDSLTAGVTKALPRSVIYLGNVAYPTTTMNPFWFRSRLTAKAVSDAKELEVSSVLDGQLLGAWRDGLVGGQVVLQSDEFAKFLSPNVVSGCDYLFGGVPLVKGMPYVLEFALSCQTTPASVPTALVVSKYVVELGVGTYVASGPSLTGRRKVLVESVTCSFATQVSSKVYSKTFDFPFVYTASFDSFYVNISKAAGSDTSVWGWTVTLKTASTPSSNRRVTWMQSGQCPNPGPGPSRVEPSASGAVEERKIAKPPRFVKASEKFSPSPDSVLALTRFTTERFDKAEQKWVPKSRQEIDDFDSALAAFVSSNSLYHALKDANPRAGSDVFDDPFLLYSLCPGLDVKVGEDADLGVVDFAIGQNTYPNHSGKGASAGKAKPPKTDHPMFRRSSRNGSSEPVLIEAAGVRAAIDDAKNRVCDGDVFAPKESRGEKGKGSLLQLQAVLARLAARLTSVEKISEWVYSRRPDAVFLKTFLSTAGEVGREATWVAAGYLASCPKCLVPLFRLMLRLWLDGGGKPDDCVHEAAKKILANARVVEGCNPASILSAMGRCWSSYCSLKGMPPTVAWDEFCCAFISSTWVSVHVEAAELPMYEIRDNEVHVTDVDDGKDAVFLNARRHTFPPGWSLRQLLSHEGYKLDFFWFTLRGKMISADHVLSDGEYICMKVRGLGGSAVGDGVEVKELSKSEAKVGESKESSLPVLTSLVGTPASVFKSIPSSQFTDYRAKFSEVTALAPTTLSVDNYSRDQVWAAVALTDGTTGTRGFIPPEALSSYRCRADASSPNGIRMAAVCFNSILEGPTTSVQWAADADNILEVSNASSGIRLGATIGVGYRTSDLSRLLSEYAVRKGTVLSLAASVAGARPVAQLFRLGLLYVTRLQSLRRLSRLGYWDDADLPANAIDMKTPFSGSGLNIGNPAFGETLDLNTWPVTNGPPTQEEGGSLYFWQDLSSAAVVSANVIVLPAEILTQLSADPSRGSRLLAVYLAAFTNYPTSLYSVTKAAGAGGADYVFTPRSSSVIVGGGYVRLDVLLPVSTAANPPTSQNQANSNLLCVPLQADGTQVLVSFAQAALPYNLCLFINEHLPAVSLEDIVFVLDVIARRGCADRNMADVAIEWATHFCGSYRRPLCNVSLLNARPEGQYATVMSNGTLGQNLIQTWGNVDITRLIMTGVIPQASALFMSAAMAEVLIPVPSSPVPKVTSWRNHDDAVVLLRYGCRAMACTMAAFYHFIGCSADLWDDLPGRAPQYYAFVKKCFSQRAGYKPEVSLLNSLFKAVMKGLTLDCYGSSVFDYFVIPSGYLSRVLNVTTGGASESISDTVGGWVYRPFAWHYDLFGHLKQIKPANTYPLLSPVGEVDSGYMAQPNGVVAVVSRIGKDASVLDSYGTDSLARASEDSRLAARLVVTLTPTSGQFVVSGNLPGTLHRFTVGQTADLFRAGPGAPLTGDASLPIASCHGVAEDVFPTCYRPGGGSPFAGLLTPQVGVLNNLPIAASVYGGKKPYATDLILETAQTPGSTVVMGKGEITLADVLGAEVSK